MFFDFWQNFIAPDMWWSNPLRMLQFFIVAWIIHRLARVLARRLTDPRMGRFRLARQRRDGRVETLNDVVSSLISFSAFVVATILSLNLITPAENLLWIIGLFAGAFGLGLMPLVKDFFVGITYLFEDPFSVGEKVELNVPQPIEGVVEEVRLRTTQLRAMTGEIFTVPNGEVRVIRNFSRGAFSSADVTIRIESDDLTAAIEQLEILGQEAMTRLPNLLEPWQIINETGLIGHNVELTLVAKARFGKAADMRPKLLALIHDSLEATQINLS